MNGTPEQIVDNLMSKRSEAPSFQIVQDVEEEEADIDEGKYTQMMYEESDNVIFNATKMIKGGSMDDVFIIEKVSQEEL